MIKGINGLVVLCSMQEEYHCRHCCCFIYNWACQLRMMMVNRTPCRTHCRLKLYTRRSLCTDCI